MKLLSVDRSVCEDVCEWVPRRGSPFANLGVPLTPMLARVYGRRDRFFDHREALGGVRCRWPRTVGEGIDERMALRGSGTVLEGATVSEA